MSKLKKAEVVRTVEEENQLAVVREPLSLNQLRSCLQLTADGFIVPDTAVLSRAKYSAFLRYCDHLIKERHARIQSVRPNTKRLSGLPKRD